MLGQEWAKEIVPNPYGVGESGGDCAVTESKQNGAEPELAPGGHTLY
ncbi:MAG: hypothetical protein LBS84_06680 [Clostridiales bacterium]|nr:hypothetical protein [Clostridiales bacterium]